MKAQYRTEEQLIRELEQVRKRLALLELRETKAGKSRFTPHFPEKKRNWYGQSRPPCERYH